MHEQPKVQACLPAPLSLFGRHRGTGPAFPSGRRVLRRQRTGHDAARSRPQQEQEQQREEARAGQGQEPHDKSKQEPQGKSKKPDQAKEGETRAIRTVLNY